MLPCKSPPFHEDALEVVSGPFAARLKRDWTANDPFQHGVVELCIQEEDLYHPVASFKEAFLDDLDKLIDMTRSAMVRRGED